VPNSPLERSLVALASTLYKPSIGLSGPVDRLSFSPLSNKAFSESPEELSSGARVESSFWSGSSPASIAVRF